MAMASNTAAMARATFGSGMLRLLAGVAAMVMASNALADPAPRETILFNADWRFTRNDPSDAGDQLSYKTLHDYICATGEQFLGPNSPKHERPSGNPGENVSYVQPNFDDSSWRQLTLPHDWAIEGPFDINRPGDTGKLPWDGVGWYRKHFTLSPSDDGRRIYLDVDGAMSYSEVWLNGKFVGGWPYGYASWEMDLTPYVHAGGENVPSVTPPPRPGETPYVHVGGDNVLAIRLDNPPRSSRWYPGAGLYRNVYLVKTNQVHIEHWGTQVTTPQISDASATVEVHNTIANRSDVDATVSVRTEVCDPSLNIAGQVVAQQTAELKIPAGGSSQTHASLAVDHPTLWQISKENNLYYVRITVEQDGKTIDTAETPFGIRTIKFDVNNGFLLNGQRVQIQGVCDHSDLGALGSVANTAGLRRQLTILKSMGCNAIRTSHNPPAPQLLDLCDEMGLVVMDEGFDCWLHGKNPNDYHVLWNDWHEKDWRSQLLRDRNHPCVVLWSTGNEVPDLHMKDGPAISRQLTAIAHEEDPTRPTIFACPDTFKGVNHGMIGTADVWGENYRVTEYEKFRQFAPNLPMLGSETESAISSRGEYFFPLTFDRKANQIDFQVNSYGDSTVSWGQTPEQEWAYLDRLTYLAGEFTWTGFDYLGEPTPYGYDYRGEPVFSNDQLKSKFDSLGRDTRGHLKLPSRSSYFGIIDLCGFPKDRYYLYQSRWRSDLPMAHILPHWNWPDRVGKVTPVVVYTSGDEAELFLNGQSLGRKKKENYTMHWDDVKYQPGELRVQAYKDAKPWATDTVKTTGPAAKLMLQSDRSTIAEDGQDLAFITVTVADTDGLMVPRSSQRITFTVTGGQLVATDNGDPTNLEQFSSPQRNAFNGMALAIVRATPGQDAPIQLTASADGLASGTITVTANR